MSTEFENNEQNHNDDISSHEYDGIKELTNKAPAWIVIIFIVTIAFAGIYAIRYFGHPNNGMSQDEEYARKSAEFDAKLEAMQPEAQDAANISMDDVIAAGGKLFAEKGCLACHGMNGEGNAIGPNLTDNFWLNGCSDEDIIKIITEGKPEKGMTPYSAMMSKAQIKDLATYIKKSLIGSNPENGKDPQGEECTDS